MVAIAKKIFRTVRWNLSKFWLWLWPDIDIVGVAGSVGKTTTKELTSSVLGTAYRTVKTPANWDPIFNIPISSFRVWGSTKFVAELGVDAIGQMDTYLSLIQPRIGMLTKLSLEHTDVEHLKSLEEAIAEEVKLLEALPEYGWAVVNGDDSHIMKNFRETQAHVLTYGFKKHNSLRIVDFGQKIESGKAVSEFTVKTDRTKATLRTNLLGRINAMNAAAAVAVGIVNGLSFEDIQEGLLLVNPVEGRLNPKIGPNGLIIDDTYNASPAAVRAAVDVLTDLAPENGVLVLGDMLELGVYSEEAHFRVGEYAKESGVKAVIAYGDHAQSFLNGFSDSENSFRVESHEEAVDLLKSMKNVTVLVKGSRSMRMEKIVDALTE